MNHPRCPRPFALPSIILAALAPLRSTAQVPEPAPVLVGTAPHVFEWTRGFGALPEGKALGNTHGGIVFDGKGNLYINTDTDNAVVVYGPDGRFQRAFGKEWRGGLHAMALVAEGGEEFLFLVHTQRHDVTKCSLDGKVVWTLLWPESSGHYKSADEFRPTAIAVAADGRFFVADGYGKSWVHRYDKDRRWLGAFGGPGTEPGKMRTPHGLWIDTRGETPVLVVADRENQRLQLFDLEGHLLRVVSGDLRRPCGMHQWKDLLAVADLAGRVTLLDRDYKLVAHLGDNPDPRERAQNGIPPDRWRDGVFISPHAVRFDSEGNLYVHEWLSTGRIDRLRRVVP